MSGRELGDGDVGCGLVGLKRLVGALLALVASGELGKVAVVITLPVNEFRVSSRATNQKHPHLVIEDLRLAGSGRGDEVLVQNVEDILADLGELALDLLPVALDHGDLSLIALRLLLLLDGGDDAP